MKEIAFKGVKPVRSLKNQIKFRFKKWVGGYAFFFKYKNLKHFLQFLFS